MAVSEKMKVFAEKSSWIRKMFEEGAKLKAQHGAEAICDFSLGNPDAPPPPEFNTVVAEIAGEQEPGVHSYMPNGGYPFVREALAKRMSAEQKTTISGDDMLMTCGAAGGLNVILKAILNPGEEVVVLAPYFVEYGFYIDNHGGQCTVVPTDENFQLDLSAIEKAITGRTRAVIINSPNNPSGQIYPQGDLEQLGELLRKASAANASPIYLIADEPYRKIVFDNYDVPAIFPVYDNSIVVSSYSKDLSLPGERIGYLAVHPALAGKPQLIEALTLANRILGFVNAPAMMQRIVARLQQASVDVSLYARRKELICDILKDAGYDFAEPQGAFYVFPRTPIKDDVQFVSLLRDELILCVPGTGFGSPGHMRLAFCVPDGTINRSAEGFKRALDRALGRR